MTLHIQMFCIVFLIPLLNLFKICEYDWIVSALVIRLCYVQSYFTGYSPANCRSRFHAFKKLHVCGPEISLNELKEAQASQQAAAKRETQSYYQNPAKLDGILGPQMALQSCQPL